MAEQEAKQSIESPYLILEDETVDAKRFLEILPEEHLGSWVKEYQDGTMSRYEVMQKVAYSLWDWRQGLPFIEGVDDKWDWRTGEKILNAYCQWHGLELGVW